MKRFTTDWQNNCAANHLILCLKDSLGNVIQKAKKLMTEEVFITKIEFIDTNEIKITNDQGDSFTIHLNENCYDIKLKDKKKNIYFIHRGKNHTQRIAIQATNFNIAYSDIIHIFDLEYKVRDEEKKPLGRFTHASQINMTYLIRDEYNNYYCIDNNGDLELI